MDSYPQLSTTVLWWSHFMHSDQIYFPLKGIQEKKSLLPAKKPTAFCACTLVLNGIKSFRLVLVTGPRFCSMLQANHLFPLCAVFPTCKAGKMHRREITNLRTGIHSSGKTNELLLIFFRDPLSTQQLNMIKFPMTSSSFMLGSLTQCRKYRQTMKQEQVILLAVQSPSKPA